MPPWSQLLVERVEVGLPEPGQLLIIFHSTPPAGWGGAGAEVSIQLPDSLHLTPSLHFCALRGDAWPLTPQEGLGGAPPYHGHHLNPFTQAPIGGAPQ